MSIIQTIERRNDACEGTTIRIFSVFTVVICQCSQYSRQHKCVFSWNETFVILGREGPRGPRGSEAQTFRLPSVDFASPLSQWVSSSWSLNSKESWEQKPTFQIRKYV